MKFSLFFLISLSVYSMNSISFNSEMIYMKTLKSNDYKNIHNGLLLSYNFNKNIYINTNLSTNIKFNKLSKFQLELAWMYEFYFFDIHPFIGYAGGYYLLNDKIINHLLYLKINGGVLFHFYSIWKRLKVGTNLSIYTFLGYNKYLAISISGIFFIKVEF